MKRITIVAALAFALAGSTAIACEMDSLLDRVTADAATAIIVAQCSGSGCATDQSKAPAVVADCPSGSSCVTNEPEAPVAVAAMH
jgi:hypothetical protein